MPFACKQHHHLAFDISISNISVFGSGSELLRHQNLTKIQNKHKLQPVQENITILLEALGKNAAGGTALNNRSLICVVSLLCP